MSVSDQGDKKPNPGHFKPGNTIGGRWQPGQSGNPGGRPKSKPFKEALERQLAVLAMSKGIDPDKGYDVLAAAMLAKVMGGDVAAFNAVADRTEGKVPTPIGGSDELPPITAFAWKPVLENIPAITNESTNDE